MSKPVHPFIAFFLVLLLIGELAASAPCVQPGSPEAANAEPAHLCQPCRPVSSDAHARRVRREIRSLSEGELERVVNAMHVMKDTPQEEGEQLYGTHYKQWEYFVTKHAVTATDSRGDQGHFSAAFMTWHSAFLYEFENSLLAVDPEIDGLPYWDSTLRSPSVFSPQLFGSSPGTGPGFEVEDGLFANFALENDFSLQDYEDWFDNDETVAFESASSGLLRSSTNELDTLVVTRFGSEFYYEEADFDLCRSLQGAGLEWEQWYECIDLGTVNGVPRVEGNSIPLSFSHHSGPHIWVGGTTADIDPTAISSFADVLALSIDVMGDFMDVVTSPNEPLFMLHHANLDRSKMWWMYNNQHLAPTYWGFPASGALSIPVGEEYDGINLNDPMASAWGFSEKLFGWGGSEELLTHADSLCNLSPYAAPYVYDDMADLDLSPSSTDVSSSSGADRSAAIGCLSLMCAVAAALLFI